MHATRLPPPSPRPSHSRAFPVPHDFLRIFFSPDLNNATVGDTPIIKINKLAPEGITMYAKAEFFNPCSSVKDRCVVPLRPLDGCPPSETTPKPPTPRFLFFRGSRAGWVGLIDVFAAFAQDWSWISRANIVTPHHHVVSPPRPPPCA